MPWTGGTWHTIRQSHSSSQRELDLVHSLWPSDAIWRHITGSTLIQVMACCLAASSLYTNQWWIFVIESLWYTLESNFTASPQNTQCLYTTGKKYGIFFISAIFSFSWDMQVFLYMKYIPSSRCYFGVSFLALNSKIITQVQKQLLWYFFSIIHWLEGMLFHCEAASIYVCVLIRCVVHNIIAPPRRGFWSPFGGVCSLTYCNGNFRVTMVSEPFNVIL